jgi:hypothetical protein
VMLKCLITNRPEKITEENVARPPRE